MKNNRCAGESCRLDKSYGVSLRTSELPPMARIPYLSYTLFVLNARAKPKSSSPGVCVPECEKGES